MTNVLSYIPGVSRLVSSASDAKAINIPSVEIHHIETDPDRRARCLKHLLKANHVNYAILYHDLQRDNHNPHALSSAYLLGASESQLYDVFNEQIKRYEPWEPSPAEVIEEDWEDFWGDRRYQRAYVDFFEDKLAMRFSYDWKKEVNHFIFTGKQPLFHGLIGGLGHPLIHLGYAFEMDSKEVAMEALAMACVQYNWLHKYIDNPRSHRADCATSSTPLELLQKMSTDKRFNALPANPGLDDLEQIFEQHEELLMEYWSAWDIDDPIKHFRLSQEAAVDLFVASVRPATHAYNFLLVHLLTTSHAVRILLPFFPAEHHLTLVKEWWLLVIAMFVVKGRPQIDPDNVISDTHGKHWAYVEEQALTSKWRTDAHYIKAVRAVREAASTWGDPQERYLKAAITFVDNFQGWDF